MPIGAHQFRPPDEPADDPTGKAGATSAGGDRFPLEADDLPYKVEVWAADGRTVEQVVAVSLSSAIGYAAYYAATREFSGRTVTLRHKGRVMSRWIGQPH